MDLKFRPLEANEIDCRISMVKANGVGLLLYKDARCDQKRLDETVGAMNWQRHHTRENANCIVSIWDNEKQQWIEKEDTGTESNTEKAKGLASDSFKRACFNWGIGRELYTAPFIWVKKDDCNLANGKCYDTFSVIEIAYDKKEIVFLSIKNDKTGNVCYTYDKRKTEAKEKVNDPAKPISNLQASVITKMLEETKSDVKRFLALYKVNSVEEMTVANYVDASRLLDRKKREMEGENGAN